ncbi:MAG: aldehyde dehydrogenase family protein [Bacteroidota bacterium]|jgi:aldehyde dehydrogenase (NAD+)
MSDPTSTLDLPNETARLLRKLGVPAAQFSEGDRAVRSPIDGSQIGRVKDRSPQEVAATIERANKAYLAWRMVPPPKRGELVRLLGEELRAGREDLGRLVSLEAGKITQEGIGEVQEMIDICDFAVGLSRQLYGKVIASERPMHKMLESWHPLGVCGIITAFNFPVAVWSWNATLALVCGNALIWKPSEKTPLTALAVQSLFERACRRFGSAPDGLSSVVIGGSEVGKALVEDARVPLISATGSTRMGREVAPRVAARFGRSILELGGNNGMLVAPSADLKMAVRAIAFAAVGTAGQRCTTLRRLFVHDDAYASLVPALKRVYGSLPIGSPLEAGVLVGPLIDAAAYEAMQRALSAAAAEGGTVFGGERVLANEYPQAYYVRPALVEMPQQTEIVRRETFAPILYVMRYRDLDQAIAAHNDVPQGLSSSIFTRNLGEAELFVSSAGSDCGLANVNIGPSGAEIGGAFGGEKETGGGREAGSDAWKAYMRRATNTINFSSDLPLAQGIKFDVDDSGAAP